MTTHDTTPRCQGTVKGQSYNLRRAVAIQVACGKDAKNQVTGLDLLTGQFTTEKLCGAHTGGARRRKVGPVDVRPLDADPFVISDELAAAGAELASAHRRMEFVFETAQRLTPKLRQDRVAAAERLAAAQATYNAAAGAPATS